MSDFVRIWYVSSQRLCNFRCAYCVSINEYAKSNSVDWLQDADRVQFERIVEWIGNRPFQVGVRLASLGEPFASRSFLDQAGWLSNRSNVKYVELLTNGSLLRNRLEYLGDKGNLGKISLWITHHHSEIGVDRFIENARLAQERYGCFVVVNGLIFPENQAEIAALKSAADSAGLRFNLDFGYDPWTPQRNDIDLFDAIPSLKSGLRIEQAINMGANEKLVLLNMTAMRDLEGRGCRAGHDYFYIDIYGNAYRCSRYQAQDRERMGNVLHEDFELHLNASSSSICKARNGCCNKEDFVNLSGDLSAVVRSTPSLGWTGCS